MTPKVFIGSSSEGLSIAEAVKANIDSAATVSIWSQGIFEPSDYTLEALIRESAASDFGIFILRRDDIIKSRGKSSRITRDNVLFELGLFIGALGKDRNFIFFPAGCDDFHAPTDLAGLTLLRYDSSKPEDELIANTGTPSAQIKKQIKKLGFRFPTSHSSSLKNSELTIQKGDLFSLIDEEKTVLLPANVYFDTINDSKILDESSTLSKRLALLTGKQREKFDATLDSELSLSKNLVDGNQKKEDILGRRVSYKLGTTACVETLQGNILLSALSYLDNGNGSNCTAKISEEDFAAALQTMWRNIKLNPVRGNLIMPVLGTGIIGIKVHTALAYILLSYYNNCSDARLCHSLTIVIYEDKVWGDGKWVKNLLEILKP